MHFSNINKFPLASKMRVNTTFTNHNIYLHIKPARSKKDKNISDI